MESPRARGSRVGVAARRGRCPGGVLLCGTPCGLLGGPRLVIAREGGRLAQLVAVVAPCGHRTAVVAAHFAEGHAAAGRRDGPLVCGPGHDFITCLESCQARSTEPLGVSGRGARARSSLLGKPKVQSSPARSNPIQSSPVQTSPVQSRGPDQSVQTSSPDTRSSPAQVGTYRGSSRQA